MSFADVRQALLRDFAFCVEREYVPPLSSYLPDFVKSGYTVDPEDYRLVPLTASSLQFVDTSSNCLTDCMIDLQSKYKQFIEDNWGGRTEKGRREIGVIGFNILEGVVLQIQAIDETSCYGDWAGPIRSSLAWERLLIHAVVDFGRYCKARQVRLQPAHRCPVSASVDAQTEAPEFQAGLKQRYDASAVACGFGYDPELDDFVLDLSAQ